MNKWVSIAACATILVLIAQTSPLVAAMVLVGSIVFGIIVAIASKDKEPGTTFFLVSGSIAIVIALGVGAGRPEFVLILFIVLVFGLLFWILGKKSM